MRLEMDSMSGVVCPYCGVGLRVEATWECDGEPYPDQNVKCPSCYKKVSVSQHVVTELEEVR